MVMEDVWNVPFLLKVSHNHKCSRYVAMLFYFYIFLCIMLGIVIMHYCCHSNGPFSDLSTLDEPHYLRKPNQKTLKKLLLFNNKFFFF